MQDKRKLTAMVGMDGSGKSANLSLLKKDPDFSEYAFLWVRWEPYLLKPLYRAVNKTNKTDTVSLNDSYQKKAGVKKRLFKSTFVRNLWLLAAVVDYTVQFRKKTRKALRSGRDIVFDRYYLDLFVDQGINFGSSPKEIEHMIRKFSFLFPQMDQTIYIRVHPGICFSRKDDIPNLEYLEKRWDIYEHLSEAFRWNRIDGEQPLETVYGQIRQAIKEDK